MKTPKTTKHIIYTYEDNEEYAWTDAYANLSSAPIEGYIVAWADMGLWDGRHQGSKIMGCHTNNILNLDYDVELFCDRYDVRANQYHHDGTNYVLFRVAKTYEKAEELFNRIVNHTITLEQFRHATKSLRPAVAKVYGW